MLPTDRAASLYVDSLVNNPPSRFGPEHGIQCSSRVAKLHNQEEFMNEYETALKLKMCGEKGGNHCYLQEALRSLPELRLATRGVHIFLIEL